MNHFIRLATAAGLIALAAPAMADCTKPDACAEAQRLASTMQLDSGAYAALMEFKGVEAVDETVIVEIILKAGVPGDQASRDALGQMLQDALMTNMCSMEEQPPLFTLGGALRLRGYDTSGAVIFDIVSGQC